MKVLLTCLEKAFNLWQDNLHLVLFSFLLVEEMSDKWQRLKWNAFLSLL